MSAEFEVFGKITANHIGNEEYLCDIYSADAGWRLRNQQLLLDIVAYLKFLIGGVG